MPWAMEDCYYFLYSSCKLQDKCVYRHNEDCKNNLITCRNWKAKKNCRVDCPFRHSEYHLKKNRDEEMCYWESKPSGCTKTRCEYKHMDPAKDSWKEAKVESLKQTTRDKTWAVSPPAEDTKLEDYEEVVELQSPEDSSKIVDFSTRIPKELESKEAFQGVNEIITQPTNMIQEELNTKAINKAVTGEEKEADHSRNASLNLGDETLSKRKEKNPELYEEPQVGKSDMKEEDGEKANTSSVKADTRYSKSNANHPSKYSPTKVKTQPEVEELDTNHSNTKRTKVSSGHTNKKPAVDNTDLEDLDKEIEELDNILAG